mmetsp:Transcript_52022/g.85521  ORF Transcript_52022/g.85521 Transcript_52022/m.85521 type:complete len:90 (-) Transcript_52022:170-439(-)
MAIISGAGAAHTLAAMGWTKLHCYRLRLGLWSGLQQVAARRRCKSKSGPTISIPQPQAGNALSLRGVSPIGNTIFFPALDAVPVQTEVC